MRICESCAKPLTTANRGTDEDGGRSGLYCDTCYQHGEFVTVMTLDDMREHVAGVLKGKGIPRLVQSRLVANVENLERWRVVK